MISICALNSESYLEMPSRELRRTEGTVLSSDSLLTELIPRCGVSEWDNEYVNIEQEAF